MRGESCNADSSPEPAARLFGGGLEWCRASRLAPGKRQQASAVQGLRLSGSEGRERRGSEDGMVGSQAKGGSFSVEGGWDGGFCELSRTVLSRITMSMSAKIRDLPNPQTVTSVPISRELIAHIVSIGAVSEFWIYDFVTTARVCDPSFFAPERWKKFFYFRGNGFPASFIDELQIELTPDQLRRPPAWKRCFDWEVERKEVPAPYRVTTHDYVAINFWGKVVDEWGVGIPGVLIEYRIIRAGRLEANGTIAEDGLHASISSVADGLFSVSAVSGTTLSILNLTKEGYTPSPSNNLVFGYSGTPSVHTPIKQAPHVFVVRSIKSESDVSSISQQLRLPWVGRPCALILTAAVHLHQEIWSLPRVERLQQDVLAGALRLR